MMAYEQVLRSTVGLFNASDTVTRLQWKNYTQTLQLKNFFPGILGLGYTVKVSPQGLDPFIKNVRAEGFANFTVWPQTPREEYFSIVYLEPFEGRNLKAIGFDMHTEQKRKEAMDRARQTGQPTLSQMVILVQETNKDVQKGCLLYFPVYDQKSILSTAKERQAALKGFVYSAFRIKDLMKRILVSVAPEVEFEIYDDKNIDTANLFYSSHGYNDKKMKADFTTSRPLSVAGHNWTLVVTTRDNFLSPFEANQSNLIAIAGILVNLLLLFVLIKINKLSRRNSVLADAQKRFNEELESTVQLRTIELQRSNEDLESFAHVISHDLKEPVRKMLIFTDQIKRKYQNALGEGAHLLDKVSKSASRLNQMIDSILTFSTVNYGSNEIEKVDLNSIIQNVTEDLEIIILEKQAEISFQDLPPIEGNAGLMHQLFYNLINNSLKFSEPGIKPIIKIQSQSLQTGEQDILEINISDNGIGFAQEDAKRIFHNFLRLHSKDSYEGTGLGLALCKRIVERHHGTIEAIGSLQGATFIIRLPVKQALQTV